MIDITEINTEILESMTLYLSDEHRDDKEQMSSYSAPFHWISKQFTIKGVRSQIETLMETVKDEKEYRQYIIDLLRRTCAWKNGKNQDKRIKEALQIFNYLEDEKLFEESLE